MRKLLKSIGFFVFVPALCIVAALYFVQDRLIFPAPQIEVSQFGISGFKRVSIPTQDGETLFALERRREDAKAWVLILHGNGDAAIFQQEKGNILAESGFNVLLMEYRGYPGSTGSPSETGLVIDAKAAFDFIRKRSTDKTSRPKVLPIGVYAHSLGTAVAVQLANDRDVFALVLESPFDSLLAIVQSRFPWLPAGQLLKHPFRSDEIIGKLNIPILIMHGDRDRVVPLRHGQRMAGLAGTNSSFVVIDGAGHNNLQTFGTLQRAAAFFANHTAN